MKTYHITVRDDNDKPRSYTATGEYGALMDAAYDEGARGVSIKELK